MIWITALLFVAISSATQCNTNLTFGDICQNQKYSLAELKETFLFQTRELGCFAVNFSSYNFTSPTNLVLAGSFSGTFNKTLELRPEDCQYHFVVRIQLPGSPPGQTISVPDKQTCGFKTYCEVNPTDLTTPVDQLITTTAQELDDDLEAVAGRYHDNKLATLNWAFFPGNDQNHIQSIYTIMDPVTGLPAELLISHYNRIPC